MRRKDREVTDTGQIELILDGCKTCHLAMVDDGQPYVVPLSYAYTLEDGVISLYFHSAKDGRKIGALRENNAVCFEISIEGEPIFTAEAPCDSGFYYSSVIGFGSAEFIDNIDGKRSALSYLMKHQSNLDVEFTPSQAESVCVFKVVSTSYTGKMKPRP